MSTRATYHFPQAADSGKSDVTFYIHFDGYLSGGAGYFAAACRCANKRGGFPERFIRANELAQFTRSHDQHSDTEYRYTLVDTHLTVQAGYWVGDNKRWQTEFKGRLVDFLNEYNDNVWVQYGGRVCDILEVETEFETRVYRAVEAFKAGRVGNAAIYDSEVPAPEILARFSPVTIKAFETHKATLDVYWVAYHAKCAEDNA
jgi:hypothetical protein